MRAHERRQLCLEAADVPEDLLPELAFYLLRVSEYAAAEGEVLTYLPGHDEHKPREPDIEQRHGELALELEDKERLREVHIIGHGDIQQIWQQPERGAGPGADVPPQPGDQRSENYIVDREREKNVEKHAQQHVLGRIAQRDEHRHGVYEQKERQCGVI